MPPGASISIADSALVTEDHLEALGDTWCISRLPGTYSACGRVIGEAVARHQWEEAGLLAQTQPTQHRPGTSDKVAEDIVTLYGKADRAIVVHSSSQDQRRQKRLDRELQASSAMLEAAGRDLAKQTYCCRAEAEAAAQQRRARPSVYHPVDVVVEACPQYGPRRPSRHQPRPLKAMSYRLKPTRRTPPAVLRRQRQEAACVVWLTNVPPRGERAQSAREALQVSKNHQGVEQTFSFLKAPLIVNSLLLNQPERIEALGLVLLLALLLWRLLEPARRVHVETTGSALVGWDKKETQKPTAFMMMTKCAAVIVVKVGTQRPLAQPLSTVQQHDLTALGVPTAYFTAPQRGSRDEEGNSRVQQVPTRVVSCMCWGCVG